MASPVNSEATTVTLSPVVRIEECDACGAAAEVEFVGAFGATYPMCVSCDVHLRESIAQRVEDAHQWRLSLGLHDVRQEAATCQDCEEEAATCQFLHLDGRQFALCEACFGRADHEEDYLVFCECAAPQFNSGGMSCATCRHSTARRGQEYHDYLQDLADAQPEEREYDWGEEEEGDFAAEESEYDDDEDGPWDRDMFASSMADMRLDGTYALMTSVGRY